MNKWPHSTLTERLGLSYPIVQAPMLALSTAKLVATVSNAGGLGSIGSAGMTAEQISEQVAKTRALTAKAFALNFFLFHQPAFDSALAEAVSARLEPYRAELGVAAESTAQAPKVAPPFDDALLAHVLRWKPAAVSFHFGVPSAPAIAALKSAGCYLLGTATTVDEALALERAGIDAIVAQGFEAGGHRGTFAPPFSAGEIGLFALLPQVVDAVRIPVIAAGGIADGRGIAAAFTLGAAGVQLGTAFVVTPESEADPVFRRALAEPRARNTRLTRVFTGRPARAVVTRFVEELADHEQQTLPYPFQRAYTGPLGRASLARGDAEFHTLFAGQSAVVSRPLPAAELFTTLVTETERALSRS